MVPSLSQPWESGNRNLTMPCMSLMESNKIQAMLIINKDSSKTHGEKPGKIFPQIV